MQQILPTPQLVCPGPMLAASPPTLNPLGSMPALTYRVPEQPPKPSPRMQQLSDVSIFFWKHNRVEGADGITDTHTTTCMIGRGLIPVQACEECHDISTSLACSLSVFEFESQHYFDSLYRAIPMLCRGLTLQVCLLVILWKR